MSTNWKATEPAYASPHLTPGGESIVTAHHLGDCHVLRMTRIADFYLWPERVICHAMDSVPAFLVEVDFLNTVMAYWLEWQGFRALHASAVVVGGRAAAFLSASMGGKTSLAGALMQMGYRLLSDDILPIQAHGDLFLGQPGYPQMNMSPEQVEHFLGHYEPPGITQSFLPKRCIPVGVDGFGTFCCLPQPLAAIYLPERRDPTHHGTAIRITRVPPAEALFALLRDTYFAHLIMALGNQAARLRLLARLVQQVSVRRLVFPSGFGHLPGIAEGIVEDLNRLLLLSEDVSQNHPQREWTDSEE